MSTPELNLNAVHQEPVKGQLDLQIARSGVISGRISASASSGLVAGQRAALDSANTGAEVKFVAAAYNAAAIGIVIRDIKGSSPAAGDAIQVAGNFGPFMWLKAGEEVTPGELVQYDSGGGMTVVAVSAGKTIGMALDYAAASGDLIRIMLSTPVAAQS